MIEVYYLSGDGKQKIDLASYPYWLQTGDFLDYEKTYVESQGRIQEISNTLKERYLLLTVFGKNENEYYENLNTLHEIFEKDIANMTPGRLYFQKSYMQCYVFASQKTEWEDTDCMLDNEIKIVPAHPVWITEQTVSINPITQTVDSNAKGYPYSYPYSYAQSDTATSIKIDHYAASDFQMRIYGPATSVNITIAGHVYHVDYPVEEGEYMVIDSRDFLPADQRLYLVRNNGQKINIFNYRDPVYSVFKKIPAGSITIDYNRLYGIDLTLFIERSEPKWK